MAPRFDGVLFSLRQDFSLNMEIFECFIKSAGNLCMETKTVKPFDMDFHGFGSSFGMNKVFIQSSEYV